MLYKKNNPSATETVAITILSALLFICLMIVLWSIIGFVLMVAWNLVVPTLFAGPFLSFAQAFGITVLATVVRIIFFGMRVNTK